MRKSIIIVVWFVIMVNVSFGYQLEIGNSEDCDQHVPCDPFLVYSSSQLIYSSSYFEYPCTINQISFRYHINSDNPEDIINNITLMLGQVNLTDLESGYVDPSQLEIAFQGDIASYNFQTYNSDGDGWLVINLSQPYYYDTEANLIIFFIENCPGRGLNSDNFYSFGTESTTSLCFVDNFNPIDIENLEEPFYTENCLPNTKFGITIDENYPQTLLPENNSIEVLVTTNLNFESLNQNSSVITIQSNNYQSNISANQAQMIDENTFCLTPQLPFAPDTFYSWYVTYNNGQTTYSSNTSSFYTINETYLFEITNAEIVDNSVRLEWNILFENDYPYYVYRNGIEIATTNNNFFIDNQVIIGQSYFYKIKFYFLDESSYDTNICQVEVTETGDILIDDDFEDYPAFTSDLGQWHTYDNDHSESYALVDYQYPNAGEESAFLVFNPSELTPPLDLDILGEKCLVSFSAITPPTSDVLISPSFQAYQVAVKLYAKSLDITWGMERIKVGLILNNNEEDVVYLNNGNYMEIPQAMIQLDFTYNSTGDDIITNVFIESCGIQTLMLILDRVLVSSTATSNDNQTIVVNPTKIFPNPIRNRYFEILSDRGQAQIKIYNLKGQLVYQQETSHRQSRIDLPDNISSGIYFVRIKTLEGEFTQKISLIK